MQQLFRLRILDLQRVLLQNTRRVFFNDNDDGENRDLVAFLWLRTSAVKTLEADERRNLFKKCHFLPK